MFLMSIVRDSNFSKKDNDEIFSVHLGPDVKFCIKIVKHFKKMDLWLFFLGGGGTIVSESVALCPPRENGQFFPCPPRENYKIFIEFLALKSD